jgi:hypothetical protein
MTLLMDTSIQLLKDVLRSYAYRSVLGSLALRLQLTTAIPTSNLYPFHGFECPFFGL